MAPQQETEINLPTDDEERQDDTKSIQDSTQTNGKNGSLNRALSQRHLVRTIHPYLQHRTRCY